MLLDPISEGGRSLSDASAGLLEARALGGHVLA
jgi:hypothetical protein